ncbi:MAG: thiol:disulfide interchange protein [Betaproteobacteria bacterium RBG_16_66_20]|nr:MAG: thiol:disulfide interchange protein [Betaproteobacteria bacterium RBG_16_66_20]
MKRFLWPLAIFILLVGFLAVGLRLNPREVPSPLVGKAAPAFELPVLHQPDKRFVPGDMRGKVWLLNVWASWCVSCREEHPVLMELSKRSVMPILGLNYKDKGEDAQRWLKQFGDPYQLSVVDADGRIGIDYGVYGVPETYLIDAEGVIRYKQIGPLTQAIIDDKVLPLAKALKK